MRKLVVACMALAWVTLAPACGSDNGNGPTAGPVGSMDVKVLAPDNPVMATIAVQSVFDPANAYVVDCNLKPYPLPGDGTFCDSLVVLPPGLYEVVVQPTDPNCRTEQEWYKAVVNANQTTEIEITIVCGQDTGALDVIVTDEYQPVITDIDFMFPDGEVANKYVCINGDPVTISVTVEDPDLADCALLQTAWYATFGGTDVTINLLGVLGDPVCTFQATINPLAVTGPGEYLITFSAMDPEGHATQLTFPIYLIECPPPAP